jgi:hypothetical protein
MVSFLWEGTRGTMEGTEAHTEDRSDANITSEAVNSSGAGNTAMEVDLPTPAEAGTESAQTSTETKDEEISEHVPIDTGEKNEHAAEIDSPAKEGEKQKVKSGKKPKRAKAKETGEDIGGNVDDEPNPPAKEVSPKSKISKPTDPDATEKSPAQLAFEEERDDILSQTPKHVKAVFGQMVLAGWSGKAYPALALSPFDVPPGSVREQWMTMFENVRTRAVSRAPT